MSVAGGNNWLIKLFPKPDDLFIDLPDIIVAIDILVPLAVHHKVVVGNWLDLQIVIEAHKPCDLFWGPSLYNSAVQFACAAGTSNDKALSVLDKLTLRDKREPSKVINMGLTYKRIEVDPSKGVLCKDYAVVRTKMPYHLRGWLTKNVDLSKV